MRVCVRVCEYYTCTLYTHNIPPCSHENGTIKFWDVTSGSMRRIHELKTANLFVGQEPDNDLMNEDFSDFKWPPFRKVSSYDPYEDDPRLAIKFIEFCPHSKTLCVGGNGGQAITFSLSPMPTEIHLEVQCTYTMNENIATSIVILIGTTVWYYLYIYVIELSKNMFVTSSV